MYRSSRAERGFAGTPWPARYSQKPPWKVTSPIRIQFLLFHPKSVPLDPTGKGSERRFLVRWFPLHSRSSLSSPVKRRRVAVPTHTPGLPRNVRPSCVLANYGSVRCVPSDCVPILRSRGETPASVSYLDRSPDQRQGRQRTCCADHPNRPLFAGGPRW